MTRANEVTYGRVTAVSGSTLTVDLEANTTSVTVVALDSYAAPTVGDRCVIVGNNLAIGTVGASAWTSWSPTFNAGVTTGNGSFDGSAYMVTGSTCWFRLVFTLGSTSSVTGTVTLALPFTMSSIYAADGFLGIARDASPTGFYQVQGNHSTTAQCVIRRANASGTNVVNNDLSGSQPFTWASGDVLSLNGCFEIA